MSEIAISEILPLKIFARVGQGRVRAPPPVPHQCRGPAIPPSSGRAYPAPEPSPRIFGKPASASTSTALSPTSLDKAGAVLLMEDGDDPAGRIVAVEGS